MCPTFLRTYSRSSMIRYICPNPRLLFCPLVATLTVCALLANPEPVFAQLGGGPGGGGFGQMPEFREDDDAIKRRNAVPYYGTTDGKQISEVNITGNRLVSQRQILSMIKSRTGRIHDPEQEQIDVRTLVGSGLFRDVRVYRRESPAGISITFEVFERPVVSHVHFVGNDSIKDKSLIKEVGIKPGDPLNRFAVDEGRRRIEEHYRNRGHAQATVTLIENKENPTAVAYRIHEGPKQRVRTVSFVGNQFVDGSRLKAGAQIQSKPGVLWLFGGKLNFDQLDEDIDRLYAYYRSFGYFRCRIGRMPVDPNDKWLDLKFVIDEGPRYRVRSIDFTGNQKHTDSALTEAIELQTGEYFNLAKMQRDLSSLRDLYGGEGFVFNEINPELKFDREPGVIDLVYNVSEGDQFRVGRILVNINGDESHTRNSVVLNRLSFRPGDLIDVRKIRASERRLASSQLFLYNPAQGAAPKIAVKPSDDGVQIARQPHARGDSFRGQSPHTTRKPLGISKIRYADVLITGRLKSADASPSSTRGKSRR